MIIVQLTQLHHSHPTSLLFKAICLEMENEGGSASALLSPFRMLAALFNYVIGQIAWTIIRFEIHHLWNPDWTVALPQYNDFRWVVSGGR